MDLSVIIPCRNEQTHLPRQLDALAAQEWDGEWEVIVADNGSTDATASIASGHQGLAGRIRVVNATGRANIAHTRRKGVEASQAMSVVFCDGDDVVAPGWVAAIGNALRDHDLVTGSIDLDRLNEPALAASRGTRRVAAAPMYGHVPFARGNNGGMTRRAWDDLGGFDEAFPGLEDIELSLRAATKGYTVHYVPEALVHYRYRAEFRALWRQGTYYGKSFALLNARHRELGLGSPPRTRVWKSWLWLVLMAPVAAMRRFRYRRVWTLASRVGGLRQVLRGSGGPR